MLYLSIPSLEYNGKETEHLTVKFKSKSVLPKKSEHIPIYFHPKEIIQYQTNIPLLLNSKLYTIPVYGQGVPLLLELINSNDKFVDLGATTVKKSVSKTVKVINNSSVDFEVMFGVWEKLPLPPKKILKPDFIIEKEVIVKKPEK